MLPIRTKKELDHVLKSHSPLHRLGLVPTMGSLHKGHVALVEKAVSENDKVVVSIFVNPTQFNNPEDLQKYPRDLEKDLVLLESISPDILVFAPAVEEIYFGSVKSKSYDFQGLDQVMEGEFRVNHFNGVGTIVEQLFLWVEPDNAYFGEKDFQQLRIIQKLVEIKKIPVNIIPCPIIREAHGLAMSSRNERLSPTMRQKAGFIYKTLQTAKTKFGTKSAQEVKEWVSRQFHKKREFTLEYFEIADVETLAPVKRKVKQKKYRAFIAVYAEDIRLIDNIALN